MFIKFFFKKKRKKINIVFFNSGYLGYHLVGTNHAEPNVSQSKPVRYRILFTSVIMNIKCIPIF